MVRRAATIDMPIVRKKGGNGVQKAPGELIVRPQRAMTDKRKQLFVEELAKHGIFAEAARVASPHSMHGAQKSFKDEMIRDGFFRKAVEEAQEAADNALILEARRRAVEGVSKNVYQKAEQVFNKDGSPATFVQYSDAVLLRLLQARFPEFRDSKVLEHSGTIEHRQRAFQIERDDLYGLSQEQRIQLKGILESIAQARGETDAIDRNANLIEFSDVDDDGDE